MKRLSPAILLIFAGCSSTPAAGPASGPTQSAVLALGQSAPLLETSLTNIGSAPTTVKEHLGEKGTLVVFTCNHCPWAKAWESRLAELGNAYQDLGIGVIAISPNDPAEYADDNLAGMEERAHQLGLKFPYAMDPSGDVTRAYGATKTPEVFLFGADAKLVYHGAIDDNAYEPDKVKKRYLKDALDAVVAGTEVKVPKTKALGCGIKPVARAP